MTTQNERQELAREFKGDLLQMQRCLKQADYEATDDELILAWSTYSKSLCAGWLSLPGENDLLQILLGQLTRTEPSSQQHLSGLTVEHASGDPVIKLPTQLLEQLGWTPGDKLQVSTFGESALLVEKSHKRPAHCS